MRGNYRRTARRDATEKPIVDALRAAGASVAFLVGTGVPDIVVGYHGRLTLCEVKSGDGEMTVDQQKWHAGWKGAPVVVLRTVEDALALIRPVAGPGDTVR